MKKVLVSIVTLLIIFTGIVQAEVKLPNATQEFYINDFADILSNNLEKKIVDKNKSYEKTKVEPQIVVVTVESLEGMDIETYSVELFEKWKIGSKDYDNGVLILASKESGEIRIEVGYGLEGAINDAKAGRIIDSSLKDFTDGNYDLAIREIFFNVVSEIEEEYGAEELKEVKDSDSEEDSSGELVLIIAWFMGLPLGVKIAILAVFIVLIVLDFILFEGNITLLILRILASMGRSSGGGRKGGGRKGGGGRSGGGGSSR